ncbi:PLP-dependent aminotransferase family protein [Brevifollis gellanilyticus]|uniref:GntR family transcriptional regulator n=1 Tax=Brevifollis gellanilyticus TaxID=748831 RepID=A0A512M7M8_9BACT|nr:PLP-dependent aminotransferase family protein [Brevifollis gellanilyticus]GEP42723.1 GntR family transcriptional regulator [Brevifollis gellanilyticus]
MPSFSTSPVPQPLYLQIADAVAKLIADGVLRPGEKTPSLRAVCDQHGVSMSTAVQAFVELETRGLVEPRHKSGFFVKQPAKARLDLPGPPRFPMAGSLGNMHASLFDAVFSGNVIALGGAVPSADILPTVKLNRMLAEKARHAGERGVMYDLPPGSDALRRQISKRMMKGGAVVAPSEIITTCGATEALMLCLRAVTQPGDVVAVESPTYFGILHVLETLGLRVLEIPTDPVSGMKIDALEKVLKKQRVNACLVLPAFSNPLGASMPDEAKQKLVMLLKAHEIPLIEDDVFGELHFGPKRGKTCKSFDDSGLVLFCSSFSKTLAPGYRVGWAIPGRFYHAARMAKLTHTLATPTLPELAIAGFLAEAGYDHWLRSVRKIYKDNVTRMRKAILEHFPAGTTVTSPQGGFLLWVTMPPKVNALELYERALAKGISIAPGHLFSLEQRYTNCLRISCGERWSPRLDAAIRTLGRLAGR